MSYYILDKNDHISVRLEGTTLELASDRLIEIFKAEADGRLLVLPCKVGDTVYVIDWYLDCDIDGQGVCDDYEKGGDIACGYCHHNYVKKFVSKRQYESQKIEDFGKTVFLTREEAEAALAADKNVGHTEDVE